LFLREGAGGEVIAKKPARSLRPGRFDVYTFELKNLPAVRSKDLTGTYTPRRFAPPLSRGESAPPLLWTASLVSKGGGRGRGHCTKVMVGLMFILLSSHAFYGVDDRLQIKNRL